MRLIKPLLISCYELGHQPLALAWPLARLRDAGFAVRALDLAVEQLDPQQIARANFIAIATPMHTALRLGVAAATQIRALNPSAHICFYGLYAWANATYLLHPAGDQPAPADCVIAGEIENALLALVEALAREADPATVAGVQTAQKAADPILERLDFPLPERSKLPPLAEYAHFIENGLRYQAGYVESSRGCLHTCTHCPVVPVYGGRFFIVPAAVVLADIRQQVEAGARHISFGDPDFLNGPGHALKIARALHQAHPLVTFDFTTKVEHLLQHRDLLPELRALGAAFVISAFESTSEHVLTRLEKGHTLADMESALELLAAAQLPVQPTWVPFTPWTTLDDYLHMLAWIRQQNLIQHVPAVQYGIRLLVPPHSALLAQPDAPQWFGELDAANFSYRWTHPDPCMDELQARVAKLVEQESDDAARAFAGVEALAYGLANRPVPTTPLPTPPLQPPPRLTEDWFC